MTHTVHFKGTQYIAKCWSLKFSVLLWMPTVLVTLVIVCYNAESAVNLWQSICGLWNNFGSYASVPNPGCLHLYLDCEFVFK